MSIEVDVISTEGFELAAEAIENAASAEVFDKNVKIVSPEYLILLKLLPLSSQDEIDIRKLMKKADLNSLKTLAEKHSLLPKLEPLLINPRKLKYLPEGTPPELVFKMASPTGFEPVLPP
jgi:hypothetical protein